MKNKLKSDLILDELTSLYLDSKKALDLDTARLEARRMFTDIEKLVVKELGDARNCIDND